MGRPRRWCQWFGHQWAQPEGVFTPRFCCRCQPDQLAAYLQAVRGQGADDGHRTEACDDCALCLDHGCYCPHPGIHAEPRGASEAEGPTE